MAKHSGMVVLSGNSRTYYEINKGDKSWIVFLHGTTVNHTVFHHQIDYFKERLICNTTYTATVHDY